MPPGMSDQHTRRAARTKSIRYTSYDYCYYYYYCCVARPSNRATLPLVVVGVALLFGRTFPANGVYYSQQLQCI